MASQSKSIACAAAGVLCLAASAWGQFSEPITGFETDRDGNALLMQPASFGDLEVCVFQDPREAVVTAANVVADIAATPPVLPSTEESFTANFTADSPGFFGAGGSTQFMDIRFQWATPSNANRWVLVETLQSPIWGDPSLHLEGKVRMMVNFPNFTTEFPSLLYTQKVGVALLIRETGKNFPQGIQDTGAGDLEFVGVTSVANANTASPVPVPVTSFNAPTSGWVSLEFDLDALELAGRVKGWTYYGGDGVLDATANGDLVNRGVLAGLVLTVDSADTTSNYVEFLVDNVEFDAPVGDPKYAPRLGTPIVESATSVRVNDVLSSSTNVALEIDRSDVNNEDPFAADQTYNVSPGGALYVNITVSPPLAIGDRLRARQTNPSPGGTSAYSIVIPVNPPAAFSLTLSLDEDGNFGVAPVDFEWVGASSVSGTAGTQGKPVFARCGQWQKVEFSLVPGVEPVIDFAGGNGSLVRIPPTGGLYNIDALFFTIDPTAPSTGPYGVWLDHVYIIDASDNEVVIANSESVNPFPSFRGQSTSTGTSIISGLTSYDGRFSNRLQWTFPDLAASNTCAPYRPSVNFLDTAKALGVWLLVEGDDCSTTGPPRVTLPGPSYGNATAVRVTGLDANVTSVKIYVDGTLNATLPVTGVTEVSVPVSPALSVGKMINATQTTAALGESAWSLPRPVIAPPAPTVAAGLVPGETAVTVNNCITEINGTASTVTVYVNEVSAGTAAGGTASVVVTVAALLNGQVVKATQTVNGAESPFSNAVVIANFVKINEIQYDDAGTDNYQFIELYNGGTSPANIGNWVIQVGDVGVYYTYTIPAGTTIAAGGYWVVGQSAVATVPGAVVNVTNDALNLGDSGYSGGPDREMYISLRNTSLVMLDAVATETYWAVALGPPAAAGDILAQIGTGIWGDTVNPDGPNDLTAQGRFLDGLDTDNNGYDFGNRKATPGFSNNLTNLLPYSENANALVPPAAVPNWAYSFKSLRAVDPTVAGTINPSVIPASPDGGNAMIEWEEAGGASGSSAYLTKMAGSDITFEAYVWIPPAFVPLGNSGYEEWRIGVRGTVDGFAYLGLYSSGATGPCWYWQRGKTWQLLWLLDENNGKTNYTILAKCPVVDPVTNDNLTLTGWQRLLLETKGNKVRGIFGGTYGSRGDGIKLSGTFSNPNPGDVYIGYRRGLADPAVARPPTLDAISIKAPVNGDIDGDGDVDMTDVAKFVNCMNGPNVSTPPVGCTLNEFGLADLGWDNDVDMVDFAEFQKTF